MNKSSMQDQVKNRVDMIMKANHPRFLIDWWATLVMLVLILLVGVQW